MFEYCGKCGFFEVPWVGGDESIDNHICNPRPTTISQLSQELKEIHDDLKLLTKAMNLEPSVKLSFSLIGKRLKRLYLAERSKKKL